MWCACERVVLLRIRQFSGHTEVCKLDHSIFGSQDVAALYIPMNNSLPVEILKALQHLLYIYSNEHLGEAAKLLVKILEAATLNELKNDAELVARLHRVDVLHYVLVIQMLHQIDLVNYRLLIV